MSRRVVAAIAVSFWLIAVPAFANEELIGCYRMGNPNGGPDIVISRQGQAYAIQYLGKKPFSVAAKTATAKDRSDIEEFVGDMVRTKFRVIAALADQDSVYALLDREVSDPTAQQNWGRTRFAALDWDFGPFLMYRVPCTR